MTELPTTLPNDPETLKQLVRQLHSQGMHLEWEVQRLDSLLRLARSQRFASSSEQLHHPGMQSLFPNATGGASEPEKDPVEVKGHTRKPAPRKEFPDSLPRKDIHLDIAEGDRRCDGCGHDGELKKVSEQISEKLHVKPAEYEVHRYHRPVYSCPKCETMKAPLMPAHPIPKCSVTTETLSGIAVGKYIDGLPLYRQEQIFLRGGVEIGRDKMSRWIVSIGEKLKPLSDRLLAMLLSGKEICMDETTFQVLKEQGRLPTSQSFMLVQARGDPTAPGRSIVLFHYSPSRSREAIEPLLSGFQGVLLTDGLGVYDSFGGPLSGVIHAGCWAHVRRKFVEAQKGSKASGRKGSLAEHGLSLINELFAIESEITSQPEADRLSARGLRSAPLIGRLKTWIEEHVDGVPKKSLIGVAMRYTLNQWSKLIRFLENGRIPLHNNFVENMIRPFAVGRKAWLFADTPEGAAASATLYSLLVTAKVNGFHPGEYLTSALKGICMAATESELESLLPLRPLQ